MFNLRTILLFVCFCCFSPMLYAGLTMEEMNTEEFSYERGLNRTNNKCEKLYTLLPSKDQSIGLSGLPQDKKEKEAKLKEALKAMGIKTSTNINDVKKAGEQFLSFVECKYFYDRQNGYISYHLGHVPRDTTRSDKKIKQENDIMNVISEKQRGFDNAVALIKEYYYSGNNDSFFKQHRQQNKERLNQKDAACESLYKLIPNVQIVDGSTSKNVEDYSESDNQIFLKKVLSAVNLKNANNVKEAYNKAVALNNCHDFYFGLQGQLEFLITKTSPKHVAYETKNRPSEQEVSENSKKYDAVVSKAETFERAVYVFAKHYSDLEKNLLTKKQQEASGGKSICGSLGIFLNSEKDILPDRNCVYYSGSFLVILQNNTKGYLVGAADEKIVLFFIYKDKQATLVDGSSLPSEYFTYAGPYNYSDAQKNKITVHSFKRFDMQKSKLNNIKQEFYFYKSSNIYG